MSFNPKCSPQIMASVFGLKLVIPSILGMCVI